MFKFKKMDLQHEKWIMHGLVGQALNGKLIEQITTTFCPEEVQNVLNLKVELIYKMGFEDAINQIRNSLLIIEYEELD